ncbi:RNA polymerase sigma factor [Comamonas antarctica]|uniref:RNA polymerase sigma factor n=1 Tax=Comamonas antarctica TaxID=2743470 RepID=A0A6N1X256_9BURK|nr:RNA polymerase sigma factor [Comamonas antarctica]QKV53534.1 RNA polymerase sigma factor [Comamonas antarctica]
MTSTASPVWLGLDLGWAYQALLPAIWRSTRCVHRAQDVLHDAFVRYALSGRHAELNSPHAYLRRVVQSVLADHASEARRWCALPDDPVQLPGEMAEAALLTAPSAEFLLDLQQRLNAVQATINGLPPRCREVFWLCRIEGLTQPEIARQLGITLNAVERHLIRALVDLRALREQVIA